MAPRQQYQIIPFSDPVFQLVQVYQDGMDTNALVTILVLSVLFQSLQTLIQDCILQYS